MGHRRCHHRRHADHRRLGAVEGQLHPHGRARRGRRARRRGLRAPGGDGAARRIRSGGHGRPGRHVAGVRGRSDVAAAAHQLRRERRRPRLPGHDRDLGAPRLARAQRGDGPVADRGDRAADAALRVHGLFGQRQRHHHAPAARTPRRHVCELPVRLRRLPVQGGRVVAVRVHRRRPVGLRRPVRADQCGRDGEPAAGRQLPEVAGLGERRGVRRTPVGVGGRGLVRAVRRHAEPARQR
ncbi:hypothetical protein AIIKEEIJ_02592 [Rhodococcus sp. YH1]|nr:hypothetical protein [Rhodococcus sp. YH1]